MKKFYQLVKDTRHGLRSVSIMLMSLLFLSVQFSAGHAEIMTISNKEMRVVAAITVTGTVLDENGMPLPGVNVVEKGTNNGTITDAKGKFSVNVASPQSVLVFSFVGTTTEEVVVGNQTSISVTLMNDVKTLGELVVMGYGTQEKKDVTGAVGSIDSEDFNKGVITSPQQLLQGKIAGVSVVSSSGEPGASQSMTVRGPSGLRSGNNPLYVIDGIPLDNSNSVGAVDPMSFINPSDIESIDVLKDASATAIYGARGANGVVMITTRNGKEGQSRLDFSSSVSFSKIARKMDVYSADEFREVVPAIGGDLNDGGASTDWQDLVTRTAVTQNYNMALSGGTKSTQYFASVGYQDQEGIIKENELKRYNGRLKLTQALVDDRIKVDVNLSASRVDNHRPNFNSVIGDALVANPTYAAYDAEGNPAYYGDVSNPLIQLEQYDDITSTDRIIGSISPSLEIIKGLTYKLNLGVDVSRTTRDEQYIPNSRYDQEGRLNSTFYDRDNTLLEHYLTYDFTKEGHHANILAGYSYQKVFEQERWWSISRFPENGVEPRYNPGQGQIIDLSQGDSYRGTNKPDGYAIKNELQSFFGRINYDLYDKYLFTANIRVDGSSKFGENNKYGTFPSFSAGWRISEEGFMGNGAFSDLKLRAGWGQTGNQEIPGKLSQESIELSTDGSVSYPFGDRDYPAGIKYSRYANPDLKWEVTTQTNIGLDFGLLEGSVSGSVDLFRKVTSDVLLSVLDSDPLRPQDAIYYDNIEDMEVRSKGVEVALDYKHSNADGVRYGIGANATFLDNEITGSPYTVIYSGSAQGGGMTGALVNGYVNRQPIGTFYLLDFIGIDEDGASIYRDVNGDKSINDQDRIAAGSSLPKTTYNFYGNVGYKGFDLSVNFNGVSGNKLYNNTANALFTKARLSRSLNTTDAANSYSNESINNSTTISTRYLEDASFLRLNNLTLAYTFNTEDLKINGWVKSLRLSVTGQNLFVITDYSGYDPEVDVKSNSGGYQSYGIDYLGYPKSRSIVFGLNISF
ncbi:SusC/RagA family TonB-linked outer membrane protein [Fulvivirga sediminis]|nr:TonB-dependent receptor [Fulvivirga sediminis]